MSAAIHLLLYCALFTFAHAESLGTLFYSPAERAALVAARSGIAQSNIYSIAGIVQRKNSRSVAWINGRAVDQLPVDAIIPTLVIQRDRVLIEGKPIKVGESLDVSSGQRILRLPEESVRVAP